MFVRAELIVVCAVALTAAGCRDDEPLERLVPAGARTFEPSGPHRPPPPPPPPPTRSTIAPPPPIAALVRDRFGLPTVTLYTFADDNAGARFLGRAVRRSVQLAPDEAARLVRRLASDDAFFDDTNGCTCGGVGVRIARGDEHVDFIVDCGNVYLGEDGTHAGTLADDLVEYVDSRL